MMVGKWIPAIGAMRPFLSCRSSRSFHQKELFKLWMEGHRPFAKVAMTLAELKASPSQPSFSRGWFLALKEIQSTKKCKRDFSCSLPKLLRLPDDFQRLAMEFGAPMLPEEAHAQQQAGTATSAEESLTLRDQAGCLAEENACLDPASRRCPAGGPPPSTPGAIGSPVGVASCPLDASRSDEKTPPDPRERCDTSLDEDFSSCPSRNRMSTRPRHVLDVAAPLYHLWCHIYGTEDKSEGSFKWEVRMPVCATQLWMKSRQGN